MWAWVYLASALLVGIRVMFVFCCIIEEQRFVWGGLYLTCVQVLLLDEFLEIAGVGDLRACVHCTLTALAQSPSTGTQILSSSSPSW